MKIRVGKRGFVLGIVPGGCGRERRPCRHRHWAVVIRNKAGNFVLVKGQGRITAVGTETRIVSIC